MIYDSYGINDDSGFLTAYNEIFPRQFKLKIKYQGAYPIFLDFYIKIESDFCFFKFHKRCVSILDSW